MYKYIDAETICSEILKICKRLEDFYNIQIITSFFAINILMNDKEKYLVA